MYPSPGNLKLMHLSPGNSKVNARFLNRGGVDNNWNSLFLNLTKANRGAHPCAPLYKSTPE
jgi:hypothetical protein